MSRNPLAGEVAAARAAVQEAAEKSEYAKPLTTPVEIAKKIVPGKGESANAITWTAKTVAGTLQFLITGAAWLLAQAGQTRLRATVLTLVLLLAMTAGWLAGNA